MRVFGAITALMMVYGKYPEPLSPLFLQFCFGQGDLDALTEDFVHEWAPELAASLRALIDTPDNGDLGPFNYLLKVYLGIEVCVDLLDVHAPTDSNTHIRLPPFPDGCPILLLVV
jgi:hypothetical protein